MAKYKLICCHVLWREICYFASVSPHSFDIQFLKQGLHTVPDDLRATLQAAIDAVEEGYEAILVGYGLCSNGVEGIVARHTPLVFMRGHDCITFLLGSKERYREYFDAHPGTYWYSPGWIDTSCMPGPERYEKTRLDYLGKYGEDNADYLMKMEQKWIDDYSNAAYVDLGFGNNDHLKKYTRKCADWLKWTYDELQGDPQLMINFLDGNWNTEGFLVVQPGQQVKASHDDNILKAI
jgi:hypothetical protein